jgi:hypothetical protein
LSGIALRADDMQSSRLANPCYGLDLQISGLLCVIFIVSTFHQLYADLGFMSNPMDISGFFQLAKVQQMVGRPICKKMIRSSKQMKCRPKEAEPPLIIPYDKSSFFLTEKNRSKPEFKFEL